MEFNKIAVIGAGTMGNGIAHVFALANYKVTLFDINDKAIERGIGTISKNLDRQVKKEKISQEQMDSTMANIFATTEMSADRKSVV